MPSFKGRALVSSGFSATDRTLISASAVPHCGRRTRRKKERKKERKRERKTERKTDRKNKKKERKKERRRR